MTVSLAKDLTPCTNCGRDTAPAPSIEVDPLCSSCIADFRARDINAPMTNLTELATTISLDAMILNRR